MFRRTFFAVWVTRQGNCQVESQPLWEASPTPKVAGLDFRSASETPPTATLQFAWGARTPPFELATRDVILRGSQVGGAASR